MFAWIRTPEGLKELESDVLKTDCGDGDSGHLYTCDGKGDLEICQDKTPASKNIDVFSRGCSGEGNLSHCSSNGTLHAC